MKSLHLLVLCLLSHPLLAQRLPQNAFALQRDKVDVYDYAEVTLRLPAFRAGNPFTEVPLTGTFRHESGDSVRVEGFCDAQDGSLHRVRFMPTRPGTYRFTIRGQYNGKFIQYAGSLTAVPAGRKGMVRVDPQHPYHFIWEGTGEHYFWNGTTTYWLMGWKNEQTIRDAIDRLAKLKINRIRVVINGRQPGGDRWAEPMVQDCDEFTLKLNPWVAKDPTSLDTPGFDVTRYNVAHWQRIDRMLAFARERNVNVSLIFYVDGMDHGSDPFRKANMGGEDEKRYYRYAVNRFGAFSNVMWDVTNEYHLFRNEAWAEQMGSYLRERDPYKHLTSIHGHGSFPFRASAWTDFAMTQDWDECGGYYKMLSNRQQQAQTGVPKPQINEEYGYEDHYPEWGCGPMGKKVAPGRDAKTRTRLAWEICMAGGYQTTGERADRGSCAGNNTGGGWINGRGDSTMIMLHYYGVMYDVFTSVDYWRMAPNNALTHHGTLCLANPDNSQYLLYVQSGTPILNTPKQDYTVRIVDIWTGQSRLMPDFKGGIWVGPQDLGSDKAIVLQRK
ncbi:DUF5605 domain-containing protein [Nibrella saemangeumensis]|uniref:DUF5605 domain-containing protein n=1 Tax=Nibrella saemangeumensis TaxID=1084526 RepID=A0ABP8MNG3_9BACT